MTANNSLHPTDWKGIAKKDCQVSTRVSFKFPESIYESDNTSALELIRVLFEDEHLD